MVKISAIFGSLVALIGAYLYFQDSRLGGTSLRIYSYSSFAKEWSAGPKIAALFEKEFNTHVEIIDAGDSALMVQKIKMDPKPVDLVVGLDQDSFTPENIHIGWHKIDVQNVIWSEKFPKKWQREEFVPFDWSPLTFILRQTKTEAPENWEQLLSPQYKKAITVPDPRTSNLGWQFLKWLIVDKGVEGATSYLKSFRTQIFSAPPSWSASYGLFQSGQSQLAFSYITSLLYHLWEEKNDTEFAAAVFPSGHPVQVEYMGVPSRCGQCDLAKAFVHFMLRPESQEILLHKNFMLPVIDGVKGETNLLVRPQLTIKQDVPDISSEVKKKMLAYWVTLWE